MRLCPQIKLPNQVKVRRTEGGCPNLNSPQKLLQGGFCPLFFHSLYPYFLAFTHSSRFLWVNSKKPLLVHCPHPKGVSAEIKKTKSGLRATILESTRVCPYHYQKGKKLNLTAASSPVCLNSLYLICAYGGSPIKKIRCHCSKGEAQISW